MMLRVFTTIFGATHPRKEEEDKYALMLFATVILVIAGLLGTIWLLTNFVK